MHFISFYKTNQMLKYTFISLKYFPFRCFDFFTPNHPNGGCIYCSNGTAICDLTPELSEVEMANHDDLEVTRSARICYNCRG